MVVDTWSGTMALVNSGKEAQGTASARTDGEQSSSPPDERVMASCRPVSWLTKFGAEGGGNSFTAMSHKAGDLWMTRARQHGHPRQSAKQAVRRPALSTTRPLFLHSKLCAGRISRRRRRVVIIDSLRGGHTESVTVLRRLEPSTCRLRIGLLPVIGYPRPTCSSWPPSSLQPNAASPSCSASR